MAITVTTTGGNQITASVNSGTSTTISTTSSSISVTSPASSAVTVSSKGPKGDDGADGAAGATGATGAAGATGATGAAGSDGDDGSDGPTYSVSCVDGDNSDEEKIRLTASTGATDDVVIEAGTGMSIARSGDKITLTNTVTDTDTNTNQLTTFQLEDDSGDEVTISHGKEVKFIGAGGLTVDWTDTDNGTDGDPYDLTFTIGTLNQNTTGSAATLTTPRAINGEDFDGSAAITITAAGSTLSDTVPVSKGGTNATSLADKAVLITQDTGTDTVAAAVMDANGELLIGGTSGPAVATLTAGTGISVTNADGAITITNTVSDTNTTYTAGDGITLNTAEFDIDAAQTTLTSIINSSFTKLGTAADQEYLTFGTSNEVNTFVNNTERLSVTASGADVTGALTVSGLITPTTGHLYSKTSSTHFEAQGDIVKIGSGATTQGELCYYTSSGTWVATDADAVATSGGVMLAIALGTDPDADGMLLRGMVTLDHDVGTIADELYISTTAGDITGTAPSGSGDIVRVVGYCLDSTDGQIWFNPSNDFIVLA